MSRDGHGGTATVNRSRANGRLHEKRIPNAIVRHSVVPESADAPASSGVSRTTRTAGSCARGIRRRLASAVGVSGRSIRTKFVSISVDTVNDTQSAHDRTKQWPRNGIATRTPKRSGNANDPQQPSVGNSGPTHIASGMSATSRNSAPAAEKHPDCAAD